MVVSFEGCSQQDLTLEPKIPLATRSRSFVAALSAKRAESTRYGSPNRRISCSNASVRAACW
jgi:hypothetical protein